MAKKFNVSLLNQSRQKQIKQNSYNKAIETQKKHT